MRDYQVYIEDIIGAIDSIEAYTKGLTFAGFACDKKTIDAVIRNFEVIGEATKNVPLAVRQEYPQVPWRDMAGMRDKLIHGYFGVQLEVVWKTLKERLPEVRRLMVAVIANMKE